MVGNIEKLNLMFKGAEAKTEEQSENDSVALGDSISLSEVAEKVCKYLPEGWNIGLIMENGAAWVELTDSAGNTTEFDTSNTLYEDINEAICIANGFTK